MPGRRSVSEPDVERGTRLSSWKEIAVYLNCGVRTVQRWEQIEGLPIRRHVHKTHATVHAYTAELDNWRERRTDVTPRENAADAAPRAKHGFVGRAAELTRLHEHMRCALGGTTQVVFVAGEMGIGKTALVRAFLDDIRSDALLIEGHCVQQYGAGEPYLPIIEGLTRVLRGRADHAVTQAFMRFAP